MWLWWAASGRGQGIEAGRSTQSLDITMNQRGECAYCPIVKRVSFWGERTTYAPWKRTVVFIIAAFFVLGISAVLWLGWSRPNMWAFALIGVPLLLVMALGAIVAIWGCNSCVVRMYGDV